MFRIWKYADRVMLLAWDSNDKVLLRMTPRFVAVGEGEIVELSTLIIKLLLLDKIDLL